MASVAQILVVIDCASILNNTNIPKGSIGNETRLGGWESSDPYIFMVGSGDYLLSNGKSTSGAKNQGKSELDIGVHAGDVVQWTVTDPTSGQLYSPILYGFGTGSGGDAITPPQMLNITLNVYEPANTSQPTGPFTAVSYQDYVWEATIVKPTVQIQYFWRFAVLDQSGNVLGAYLWDPFITVS